MITVLSRLVCSVLGIAVLSTCFAGVSVAQPQDNENSVLASQCQALANGEFAVNVLFLVDASSSLQRNDPNKHRVTGVVRSVATLLALSTNYRDNVDIRVAVDGFSDRYLQHINWSTTEEANRSLASAAIRDKIGATITWTDYERALEGAAQRFQQSERSSCNVLVWFTDGEHDTEEPGELTPAENLVLNQLCGADGGNPEVSQMTVDANVIVLSAVLSQPGAIVLEHLQRLYGEDSANPCPVPLRGSYKPYENISDLAGQLDEIIGEHIASSVCEGQLPGEKCGTDAAPPEQEYTMCEVNQVADECIYSFSLDEGVDAFRLYIDKTELRRGILYPKEIGFELISPDGQRSEQVRSADADESGWVNVQPFNFWVFRPYDSRQEVIGHRAAFPDTAQWEGTWKVVFWGTTSRGRQEASQIAAAVKRVSSESPKLRDAEINSEGDLVGYVDVPKSVSAAISNKGDSLHFAPAVVEPTTGEPDLIYRTWSNNTGNVYVDPIPVNTENGDFSVKDMIGTLVRRDAELKPRTKPTSPDCSVQGGGNISQIIDNGQDVVLQPTIVQSFSYGPSPELRQWRRPISPPVLITSAFKNARDQSDTEKFGRDVSACQGRQKVVEWMENVEASGGRLLPNKLEIVTGLQPPDGATRNVDVRLRLSGGAGGGDWSAHLANGIITIPQKGSSLIVRGEDGWECLSQGGWPPTPVVQGRLGCDSLEIESQGVEDISVAATVTVTADFTALRKHLDDIRWREEASQGHRDQLERLLANNQTAPLTSGQASVVIPFPGNPWPLFLVLLGVLLLTVAALGVWRRRWVPIGLPEYVVVPLVDSPQAAEPGVCAALVKRATQAHMGLVRLRTSWLRPLAGIAPNIVATATSQTGDCWSEGRCVKRGGRLVAVLGDRLSDKWVAVSDKDDIPKVVIWDIPPEEAANDRADYIADAKNRAVLIYDAIQAENTENASASNSNSGSNSSQAEPKGTDSDPLAETLSEPAPTTTDPFSNDALADYDPWSNDPLAD